MADTLWSTVVEVVQPHIVHISTPRGVGTGFLIKQHPSFCGIATAAHVISQAYYWEEPIRITHFSSGHSILLHYNERAIFLDATKDTAVILFHKNEIPFPPEILSLSEADKSVRVGIEIGWLGFPGIVTPPTPCFFGGRISAFLQEYGDYLVDGVAIHGVSGSPAFMAFSMDDVAPNLPPHITIMGVVTEYRANMLTGVALPGVAVVRHLSYLHSHIATIASLEQAQSEQTVPTTPPLISTEESPNETSSRR